MNTQAEDVADARAAAANAITHAALRPAAEPVQTAIVISLSTALAVALDGSLEVLVRIAGEHVPLERIAVDTRPHPHASWRPVEPDQVDVRHE